jgi:hypothetical protein
MIRKRLPPSNSYEHLTASMASVYGCFFITAFMSKLQNFIAKESQAKTTDDLSTDGQVLFGLLALMVDVLYRAKHGRAIEWEQSKGYSKAVISNQVLPDQTRSVDNGLEGLSSTEYV